MQATNVAMILCLQSTYIQARVRAPGRGSFTPVSTFRLCSQQKACISYTSLHNAYIRTYRLVMRILSFFCILLAPTQVTSSSVSPTSLLLPSVPRCGTAMTVSTHALLSTQSSPGLILSGGRFSLLVAS